MGRYADVIVGQRGELASSLDGMPELRGCGIGIHDGESLQSIMIRDSHHGSRLRTFVVVEIVVEDMPVPSAMARGGSRSEPRYWSDDRGQRVATESVGLLFNCGGAVLAGMAVAGSSAATAASGGAAAPLVYLSGAAAVGASLQCGVSIGRMVNVLMYDEESRGMHPNDMLDNGQESPAIVLRGALIAADVIGLLDGVGAGYRALRSFSARVAATGGNRAARVAAAQRIFDALPAHEKAQLAEEVAQALRQPLTPQMLRTFVAEGRIAGMGSQRFGQALQNVLRARLNSAIGNLALGVGSTITGGAVGAATGSSDGTARIVRQIVANVFQEGASSLSPADGGTRSVGP